MDLERHIDDVARTLTVPPRRVALRGAVVGRLRPRRPDVRLLRSAVAAAVVMTMYGWTARRTPTVPAVLAPAIAIRTAESLGPLPGTTALAAPSRSAPRLAAVPSSEEPATTTRLLPSLVAPEPITILDIQPERVDVPLLHMTPVMTEPIRVAPVPAIPPLDSSRPNSRS
jgi:hypothetical protein